MAQRFIDQLFKNFKINYKGSNSSVTNNATTASNFIYSNNLYKKKLEYEFPSYDSSQYFQFEIIHQSSKSNARVTKITTPNGIIMTPNFVPVATVGSIKFLDPISTLSLGTQLMFVNSYHMIVNADLNQIEGQGGLHKFMNYNGPLITDSGGFQVFSLLGKDQNGQDLLKSDTDKEDLLTKRELKGMSGKNYPGSIDSITDGGVVFKSYRTQESIHLSAKTSVAYQKKLAADIIIPFDELLPYYMDNDKLIQSLDRTHHWESESLLTHIKDQRKQVMFSVIHGGVDHNLRKKSIEYLSTLPFDGHAIGGSLGKNRQELNHLLSNAIMPNLPRDKPNHLLGIGDIESISQSIPLGIDSFDSSYPTRSARHGSLLVGYPNIDHHIDKIQIKKTEYKYQHDVPLDKQCDCSTCLNYSRAYLHHLFKSNEQIYYTLATIHNLRKMHLIMNHYRNKILSNEI
ncbi:methionyl-trna synthetase beta subunit [Tieghemostelium lacteum]|uniref:Methionyl-trna synthetase beta subunit n=1 Tax=Tieghemostelium lacteum TaxID=361077 RepID=A0A152A185_TIELA|nr:methionyl-trna synthetase beta subunit [Tieghemostelium lacteum]|eukprot:KYQ99958.1 methionyl-trna synthetase beta subunit [Tieghemostelium lacteum]